MFCTNCGVGLTGGPKFCPGCGVAAGLKGPSLSINELIEKLIETHLDVLVGYGSAPSDRAIIEESLTKLFNELQLKTVGGTCFTFDPATRACTSDTVDEFADSIAPLAIHAIMSRSNLQESILPCVSTFLNWFVFSIDIPVNPETVHRIFIFNLRDGLSDANLTFFGFNTNIEIVKSFYQDTYPQGREEFFSQLKLIAESSEPGEIDVLPGNRPWFEAGTDRKKLWGIARDIFQETFFPVKTSIKEILDSADWLKEHLIFLQGSLPSFLTQEYLGLIQCQESVTGNKSPISGKDKLLLFSDYGICEIYTKEKHRRGTAPVFLSRNEVTEISIGTEVHESHGGFSSSVSTFMVITIHTSNYQIRTLYVYMGGNEQELNSSRPRIMQNLERIATYYSLVEGDVAQSSSGYTMTPSIGFWHSID
jgi:hypothetical protein